MGKVVFFSFPSYGHQNPTFELVHELVNRGEEVIYYSTQYYRSKVEAVGAEFRSYQAFETKDQNANNNFLEHYQKNRDFNLESLIKKLIDDMQLCFQIIHNPVQDLKTEIADLAPDYIIHDSIAYWGKLLARELGIPAVASVSTCAYCTRLLEEEPTFVIKNILWMANEYVEDPEDTQRKLRRVSQMIGKRFNIPEYDCLERYASWERLNLVFTSRDFQPYAELFDDSYAFVGPSIASSIKPSGFPFAKLAGKKVIYISMGSILSGNSHFGDFYRKCFTAFGNTNYQVILSIGEIAPDRLGTIPENFSTHRFVPQLEILQQTDLMITHGGMNSVNEALYYQVPLIVIPQTFDQRLNGQRVADLKVGVCIDDINLVNSQLLIDISNVIFTNPSYRNNIRIISDSLHSAGGCRRAADELFHFKMENHIL